MAIFFINGNLPVGAFSYHTNNEIKKAKRLNFTKNLNLHKDDIKKTWKLINELNS